MKAGAIIERLRAQCPGFSNRVFGAAEFNNALQHEESVAVPAAYVITGFDSPAETQSAGIVTQVLTEQVSIAVCVDASGDPRGQAGADDYEDLKDEILPALIGWQLSTRFGGLLYSGGQLFTASSARLWYLLDFYDTRTIGE